MEIAEVEDYSLLMEYLDVDVKHIFLKKKKTQGKAGVCFFKRFQCVRKRRASSRKQVAVG